MVLGILFLLNCKVSEVVDGKIKILMTMLQLLLLMIMMMMMTMTMSTTTTTTTTTMMMIMMVNVFILERLDTDSWENGQNLNCRLFSTNS